MADETYSEGPRDEVHLKEYLAAIWKRKWLVLAVVVALSIPYPLYMIFWQEEVYESYCKMQVGGGSLRSEMVSAPSWGGTNPRQAIEMMKVSAVRQNAAAVLEVAGRPMHWLGQVRIVPVAGTNVVQIIAKGPTRQLSRDIADALAQGYIDYMEKNVAEASNEVLRWLNMQLADVKKRRFDAEERLKEFKQRVGIPSMDHARRMEMEKLALYNENYFRAVNNRVDAETRYRRYRKLLAGEGESMDQDQLLRTLQGLAEDIGDTELLQALSGETPANVRELDLAIRQGEIRLESLLGELKERHPKVQELKQQIAVLKQQRIEEQERLTQDQQKLREQAAGRLLLALETSYEAAVEKEKQAQDALDAFKKDSQAVSDVEIEYAILEREVQVQERMYNTLLQKVENTRLAMQANVRSAQILQRAGLGMAVDQRNPLKIAFITVFAVGLSVGLCMVLEYFNTAIRTVNDVERYLGLQVVGIIPKARAVKNRRSKTEDED
jgi:uncharacterized protein involved in exopolysaccharide biosynthesis